MGDKRIKGYGSSDSKDFSEDSSSGESSSSDSSSGKKSESKSSHTSLEHTDDDFDMGKLLPTPAKKHFRTHFDVINESIQKLIVQ